MEREKAEFRVIDGYRCRGNLSYRRFLLGGRRGRRVRRRPEQRRPTTMTRRGCRWWSFDKQ